MRPLVTAGAPAAAGVEVWPVVEDGELEAPRVDEAAEHGVQVFAARKVTKLSRVKDDHDAHCDTVSLFLGQETESQDFIFQHSTVYLCFCVEKIPVETMESSDLLLVGW